MFITIKTRYRATALALFVTVGLTGLKLGAAFASHSVGMLSEGVHSFLDLISAAISFFTVRAAGKPADEDHPFGHGKIETLSSLFESLLLVAAAGLIVYEGVTHLRHPEPVQREGLAICVIVISIGVSYLAYLHNRNAALKTESSALHVNAFHFLSDVIASLGVLLGLILLHWTRWEMIDPLIAFAIAGYILLISLKQVKKALLELADTQLPHSEIEAIRSFLKGEGDRFEVRELRTRKSGATRHIDFDLIVCGQLSVEASHALCDELESRVKSAFSQASVHIHVEPCEKETIQCYTTCINYKYQKR